MPILVGTDGHRKMSKSLGNQIGITDAPQEMYGKTMSIPDQAMDEYYRLLLGREAPPAETAGGPAARDAKHALAREIVAWLHSEGEAEEAAAPLRARNRAARGAGGGARRGDRAGGRRRAPAGADASASSGSHARRRGG